jgi:hypothetical protein
MANRMLLALLFLAPPTENTACASVPLATATVSAPSPKTDPNDSSSAKLSGLEVRMKFKRPLRLVEWVDTRAEPGIVGLDGTLLISMKNTSTQQKVINPQEVHGLLFIADQIPHEILVVNPSQCLRDFSEPNDFRQSIAPGETRTYTIDEWGSAGSMWNPPAPGKYQLVYRVRPPSDEAREVPADAGSPKVMNHCIKALNDPRFWKEAVTSIPVPIELKTPSRQRRSQ